MPSTVKAYQTTYVSCGGYASAGLSFSLCVASEREGWIQELGLSDLIDGRSLHAHAVNDSGAWFVVLGWCGSVMEWNGMEGSMSAR